MMVFNSNGEKNYMFRPIAAISESPRGLGILYKTFLLRKFQNLKMTAIGRNM